MLDRRGFLKFIGGAAVGTLATPVVWKGLDDISIWSQNWPWIPSLQYGNHENTYVRTVSKLCPAAGATKIRLVGGRPVRVLSDPESPLGGGVSALAVTEVQMRYSPARLKRPLLRNSDGGYREISWEEAEKLLLEKLAAAKKQTEHDSVVCISGDENGTMNELLAGFAAQTGSGRFFAMPSDAQATAQAWKLMGGRGRVGFDIPNSDYVFAVGANVLETWGSVVVNRHAWGQARPAGAEPAMRLAYAGPVQNNTAAGADLWLPIKPGTELFLLLGVARQLIKDGVAAPAGDVVIDMAYKLGINLGVSDVVTMLKAKAFNIGADWGSLSDGNAYVSDIVVPNKTLAYRFSPDDLALVEKAEAAAASSGKELAVAFVSKLGLGTPETAIPPFNTKLITDDELDTNMLVAAVNGATLKKLGLYEGNRIVLTSKAGKVMAKIRVFEGVTNDTVALTMGFGHTAFGEFNDGKGMDVMALVTPSSEPGSGLSVWNDTRVNVAQA